MSHKPFCIITPETFLDDCAGPILEKTKILNMVLYLVYASKTSAFLYKIDGYQTYRHISTHRLFIILYLASKTYTGKHNYMFDNILWGNDSIFNHLGIQLTPLRP